jgi:tight adherence protein C
MFDLTSVAVVALSFGAVAAIVFLLGQYYSTNAQIKRRLPSPVRPTGTSVGPSQKSFDRFISTHFDEKLFGVDDTLRGKLRRELLRAGFFGSEALNYYILGRLVIVIVLPMVTYIVAEIMFSGLVWPLKLLLVSIATLIAIPGPGVYLARRQKTLGQRYRQIFPDFLDLLVVCVDAGLSLEGAFDRVRGELTKQSRELGINLEIMGAEMRAGRSTLEALDSLADRLALDEARAFVGTLRQSVELGSDVGNSLRVFSDEMRDKRLLRAEESANKLPVKMVLPMSLFIFPVVLVVVLLPMIIRFQTVLFQH